MKFQFIGNACGIFISNSGKQILTDPWLNDGVFEGSWCHFHSLQTKIEDLQNVDAIYVSHVHPDHYDDRFFNFPKDIPIIVLDHGLNFLHKNLAAAGYTNLIKIKNDETVDLFDFKITLYSPFVTNNFFEKEAVIGNLIDSAMVIESEGLVAFNANDNTPDEKASSMLSKRFKKIDLAMMNYNSAGPYPSCFNNLDSVQKQKEHQKNLERNINYLAKNISAMNPKYFLPFAGAYAIGGKLHHKNKYLGTTTWDDCIHRLSQKGDLGTDYVALREGDILDLRSGKSNNQYKPIDQDEMHRYIQETLSKIVYPYEKDKEPQITDILNDLQEASIKMLERCSRINLIPDMNVYIDVDGNSIQISDTSESKGDLLCYMDLRLLRRILDRTAHWNNAEIGCHIDFKRTPNYYSPDIHTMLQFFHL